MADACSKEQEQTTATRHRARPPPRGAEEAAGERAAAADSAYEECDSLTPVRPRAGDTDSRSESARSPGGAGGAGRASAGLVLTQVCTVLIAH